MPASIASAAINHALQRQRRQRHQLFIDQAAPWTVHAIRSPRYARVHHDELAGRVLDLMSSHPAWHLPLGYKDGVFGAARLPSGVYLRDRDCFCSSWTAIVTSTIPRTTRSLDCSGDSSSETATCEPPPTLDVFSFRAAYGNDLIWGFEHVAGFRRRHVGASIQDARTRSLASVREEIAPTRDGVLEAVVQRLDVPQKQAAEAYTVAGAVGRGERPVDAILAAAI